MLDKGAKAPYNTKHTHKHRYTLMSVQDITFSHKETLHLLCKALGWQGGNIHQVSKETGLTLSQVLNLHNSKCEGQDNVSFWYAVCLNVKSCIK